MTQVRDVLGRARPLAVAVAFVAASFIPLLSLTHASAGALLSRSMLVTSTVPSDDSGSTGAPGAATNGDQVGHTYTFEVTTGANIKGFRFLVCDNAFGYAGTCTVPTGFLFNNTSPVIGDITMETSSDNGVTFAPVSLTGWTITRTSGNEYSISNATGVTPASGDMLRITIGATAATSFTNPTAAYMTQDGGDADVLPDTYGTYFVHVSTHSVESSFSSANLIDEGTVTNNVDTAIDINTRVQETLKFSVEGDMRDAVAGNNGTPTAGTGTFNGATDAATTCAPLAGKGTILMGDTANTALASNVTYDAQSYFRLATNSANGARVYYSGETLTSGSESITPITTVGGAASAAGTEQFGLTFNATSANTTAPSHSFTNLVAGTDYDSASAWFFTTETANSGAPVLLAQSPGIVACDTGAVNYIANIAEETAAGIYTTRVVYIASPSY